MLLSRVYSHIWEHRGHPQLLWPWGSVECAKEARPGFIEHQILGFNQLFHQELCRTVQGELPPPAELIPKIPQAQKCFPEHLGNKILSW